MVLIDEILSHDRDAGTTARLSINPTALFAGGDGIPGWVGIEYMAQCVAAHGGCEARERDAEPAIGYLLGTRRYDCKLPVFPFGSVLTVRAEPLFVEGGMGAFHCTLEMDGEIVASATINAYSPG